MLVKRLPRIVDDWRLNCPANHLPSQSIERRKGYLTEDPKAFLDEVRADHPEAFIVHWLGQPKPWTHPDISRANTSTLEAANGSTGHHRAEPATEVGYGSHI